MNYGAILKEIRTYDLITQEQIAKVLGISRKTYGLYEINFRILPLGNLTLLKSNFYINHGRMVIFLSNF